MLVSLFYCFWLPFRAVVVGWNKEPVYALVIVVSIFRVSWATLHGGHCC